MRGNDCDPLLAVSPYVSSIYSSVVMAPSDKPSSSSPLHNYHRKMSKIMVTQEQAADIERKTRYQSKSLSWYESHCRITSSFFCGVCRISITLSDSLVNSILNQCMYQIDATVCAWGKDNEDRSLSAFKQEWHERSAVRISRNHSKSLDKVAHDTSCASSFFTCSTSAAMTADH